MLITLGSSTDLGRRESNQDSVLAVLAQNLLPRRNTAAAAAAATAAPAKRGATSTAAPATAYVQSSALLILADGMGGRASGQLASETATKSVYRELAHTLAMQEGVDAAYLEKALDGAIQQANNRIHQLAAKNADAEGMGTTCTAALVMRNLISLGHVGDSRAYLFSSLEIPGVMQSETAGVDADITLLTADHSVVAGEVRAGRLTEDEARKSRFRNVITRAVGVDLDVQPDVFTRPVPLGTISHLVISSDGLHGSLGEAEMKAIVQRHAMAPQRAANALVSAAKRAGATDNISVIVARIDATGENYKEGAAPIDFGEDGEDYQREQFGGQPSQTAEPASNFWSRPILWQIGCAILAVAAIAAWFIPGLFRAPAPSKPPASPAPVAPAPPVAIDPSNVTYGPPQTLLPGRPVAPNVLLLVPGATPAQGNLLVVDSKERRVLRLRTSDGLVATSIPESSTLVASLRDMMMTPPVGAFTATDSAGDIYRLYPSTDTGPEIAKYDPSGKPITAIGSGSLTRPTSLAVTPGGDVFVIDSGTLKYVAAKASVQPTSTPAVPTS